MHNGSPGATTSDSHNGCDPAGVGHPSSVPSCIGPMVSSRVDQRHQLARGSSSQACPSTVSSLRNRSTCLNSHGQRDCEGARKSRGRDTVRAPHGGVNQTTHLGRETHIVADSRAHLQDCQFPSRVAQQAADRSCGVAPLPIPLPQIVGQFWSSSP